MDSIKTLYECGNCNEVHDDEDGAQECCMPTVSEVYQCPACEEIHNSHDEASKCCNAGELIRCPCCSRDYGHTQINSRAVSVAGHCNICDPLFTIEQRFLIEDLHFQQAGQLVDLSRGF